MAVVETAAGSIRVDGSISILLLACSVLMLAGKFAVLGFPHEMDFSGAAPVQQGATMTFPGQTWEVATPESQGVDSDKMEDAIRWFDEISPKDGVKRLVIARNGRLIWAGPEAGEVQGLWSITKSLSALAMGPLVDGGMCDLQTRVAEVLPALTDHYPGVTFGHLLTMTSGYEAQGDWPPASRSYLNGGSITPFLPAAPQFSPGTRYSYWDSAMNVYGLAFTAVARESIKSSFQRHFADPIGMNPENWDWGQFAKHDGVAVSGGSGNKGKHFKASAKDLARIGHLMLNRGRWGDRQIVSEEWIDELTRVQVPADLPLGGPIVDKYGDRFPYDGRGVYGLCWWINGTGPEGRRHWKDCPEGTFAAIGYNNNVLFVVPEWDLVVVRLGLDGRYGRVDRGEFAGFLARIGKSIIY